MTPLLDNIRSAIPVPRGARQLCLVCGRAVGPADERMRLRGNIVVHRRCATYHMRRRRTGPGRLGYPPR